jgi:hypothetical protein
MLEKLVKNTIATLTALPMLVGCATYDTNTLSKLEGDKRTENSAKYEIEGFSSGGVNYTTLQPRSFEVSGTGNTTYHNTPSIARTNDTLEIINYQDETVDVRSRKHYAIVPITSIKGYTHVAEAEDKTQEINCIEGIKVEGITPTSNGFGFTSRKSGNTPFRIVGMNLDERNRFTVGENRQYLFFRNTSNVFLQGTKNHTPKTMHESLPIILFDGNSETLIDRSKGKICIKGEAFKAVRATPIETLRKQSSELTTGKIDSID